MELFLYEHAQRTGPYTEAEVQAMVATNQIDGTCLGWREGMPGWLPLGEVVTLPVRPPQTQLPAGLPPAPARHPIGSGWRTKAEQLNQRLEHFDNTKLGPAGRRHLEKLLPIIGGIVLLLMHWGCHH